MLQALTSLLRERMRRPSVNISDTKSQVQGIQQTHLNTGEGVGENIYHPSTQAFQSLDMVLSIVMG